MKPYTGIILYRKRCFDVTMALLCLTRKPPVQRTCLCAIYPLAFPSRRHKAGDCCWQALLSSCGCVAIKCVLSIKRVFTYRSLVNNTLCHIIVFRRLYIKIGERHRAAHSRHAGAASVGIDGAVEHNTHCAAWKGQCN